MEVDGTTSVDGRTSGTNIRKRLQRAPVNSNAIESDPSRSISFTTAATSSTAIPSPSPSPSLSPSVVGDWDLSDLIAEYSGVSSGVATTSANGRESSQDDDDDAEDDGDHAQDDEGQEEQQKHKEQQESIQTDKEKEDTEKPTATTEHRRPGRIVTLCGPLPPGLTNMNATVATASTVRPQTNARFLTNVLKHTLLHNERVEHIFQPARALDDSPDSGAEIEVYDPRNEFTSMGKQVVKKQQQGTVPMNAMHGTLESEGARLMAVFEGAPIQPTPLVRKVKGRGKVKGGLIGELLVGKTKPSAGGMVGVPNTVAQAHLVTAAQKEAYRSTHAKYRRARGVLLLQWIAKQYDIEITIRPSGSPTTSGVTGVGTTESSSQQKEDLVDTPPPPPSGSPQPSGATVKPPKPNRLFTTSLAAIRSSSNGTPGPTIVSGVTNLGTTGKPRVVLSRHTSNGVASSASPPNATESSMDWTESPPAESSLPNTNVATPAFISTSKRTFQGGLHTTAIVNVLNDTPLTTSPMECLADSSPPCASVPLPSVPPRKVVSLKSRSTIVSSMSPSTSVSHEMDVSNSPSPPVVVIRKRKEMEPPPSSITPSSTMPIVAHASLITFSSSSTSIDPPPKRMKSIVVAPSSSDFTTSTRPKIRTAPGGILGAALRGLGKK